MTSVLITGGASGIGAALARRYARDGAAVVIADLDETAGAALAAEIGAVFLPVDVTSEQDNRAAVRAAVAAHGGLDIVHLNAGIGGGGDLGPSFDLAGYRRTLAVNIDGVMLGTRAARPVLARSGGGAIVVTSSLAGLAPAEHMPVYSATKHAAIGLVRSFAPALTRYGIRINAVCPGYVDTPILGGFRETLVQQGLALAGTAEVVTALRQVADVATTGGVWVVQAGQPAVPVQFPDIQLARA